MQLRQFIPILEWLPRYRKNDLKGDLSAGLTVGVMLIPQGMAYAMIVGMICLKNRVPILIARISFRRLESVES